MQDVGCVSLTAGEGKRGRQKNKVPRLTVCSSARQRSGAAHRGRCQKHTSQVLKWQAECQWGPSEKGWSNSPAYAAHSPMVSIVMVGSCQRFSLRTEAVRYGAYWSNELLT